MMNDIDPDYETQARCNLACLLHLVGLVEQGETEEALSYSAYVRAMLRLAEFTKESE